MFPKDESLFQRASSVSLYDAGQMFSCGEGEGGAFGELDFVVAQIESHGLENLYRSLGLEYKRERVRIGDKMSYLDDTYQFTRGAEWNEKCEYILVCVQDSSLLHLKIKHNGGWVQRATYHGRYAIDWEKDDGNGELVT